ncbi:MAG: DMT family transporter [Rhodospirillales bacterium]
MPSSASLSAPRRDLILIPLLLLILGSMWGASFSLGKLGIEGGIPELGYATWQALGSAVIVFLVLKLRRSGLPRGWPAWRFCLVSGLVGICIPNLIFYFVISHLPAGLMAVVVTTAPIITYGLALTAAMERLTWLRSLGIALGFLGALVIVLPAQSLPEGLELEWLLLAFLTPFCYALSNLYAGRYRPAGQSSLGLACGMLVVAGTVNAIAMVALIPVYLPLGPLGDGSWGVPEAALLGQVLISSLAYVIYFHIVQAAGAVYFSQVGYIVTVTGLLWGMWIFGEQHSAWIYGGTALILFGFALVNIGRARQPPAGSAKSGTARSGTAK